MGIVVRYPTKKTKLSHFYFIHMILNSNHLSTLSLSVDHCFFFNVIINNMGIKYYITENSEK
jgi:hypothetical protein